MARPSSRLGADTWIKACQLVPTLWLNSVFKLAPKAL